VTNSDCRYLYSSIAIALIVVTDSDELRSQIDTAARRWSAFTLRG